MLIQVAHFFGIALHLHGVISPKVSAWVPNSLSYDLLVVGLIVVVILITYCTKDPHCVPYGTGILGFLQKPSLLAANYHVFMLKSSLSTSRPSIILYRRHTIEVYLGSNSFPFTNVAATMYYYYTSL